MEAEFFIVDVFAEEKYTGNQLAVITDAAELDTETMQAIAAEMAYSETTFVTGPPEQGVWPVRIFTPTDEIPFAGHPTLGTAAVIREELRSEGSDKLASETSDALSSESPDELTLGLGVGEIPVQIRREDGREVFWMQQREPSFGPERSHEQAATVLGLQSSDSGGVDTDWPVQVVSTGLPTVIVPLTDRNALTDIELNRAAYDKLVGATGAKLVLAFCPDPRRPENDIAARMFAPALGVTEDPATGSANGCLGAYLARHEYFGSLSVTARVEQGHELGRPSLLLIAAQRVDETVRVSVGGEVKFVARGVLQ